MSYNFSVFDLNGLQIIISTSYRDLLGTADEIVQLNERMQETEKLLADVSLQCNVDIIDKKARKLAQLQEQFAQQSQLPLVCCVMFVESNIFIYQNQVVVNLRLSSLFSRTVRDVSQDCSGEEVQSSLPPKYSQYLGF